MYIFGSIGYNLDLNSKFSMLYLDRKIGTTKGIIMFNILDDFL